MSLHADLYSEKNIGPAKAVDTLTSNELSLLIEGRPAAVPAEAITPAAVTGGTTFNKCTTTQQSTLISARSQASTYSADALSYLNAGKTGSRYTTWFGTYDTHATVRSRPTLAPSATPWTRRR